jgi:hypothetical protein
LATAMGFAAKNSSTALQELNAKTETANGLTPVSMNQRHTK